MSFSAAENPYHQSDSNYSTSYKPSNNMNPSHYYNNSYHSNSENMIPKNHNNMDIDNPKNIYTKNYFHSSTTTGSPNNVNYFDTSGIFILELLNC